MTVLSAALEGREQQWLVKSESQILRFACALTYLDWASLDDQSGTGFDRIGVNMEPDEVPKSCMVAATKLLREYFWPHARAALRQIGLTDRHRDLRRTLRWIRASGQTEISLKGPSSRGLRRQPRCRPDPRFAGSLGEGGMVASRKNRHERSTEGTLDGESKNIRVCRNCINCRKSSTRSMFRAFCSFCGSCSSCSSKRGGRDDEAILVHQATGPGRKNSRRLVRYFCGRGL